MQNNEKFQRQLVKIENKLAFLQKAASYNLTPEQKDWAKKQYATFEKIPSSFKALPPGNEFSARVAEDLYNNLRKTKKKIISWMKIKSTDIDMFKKLRKDKGEGWIPLVDMVTVPPRISGNVDLWDINFPCMSYTNEELCKFSETMFQEQNVLAEHNVTPEKLSKIIARVCFEYNVPAYHNFAHGFNVCQMVYTVIKKTELEAALNKTEIFAALLAALGHDLNHRGFNNAFETKLKTQNSVLYSDNSVLENMHAALLIQILKEPEIGFFEGIADVNKRAQFRDLATAMILATDMTAHNKLLNKFTLGVKATVEYRRLKSTNQTIDKSLEERAFVLERAHDKRKILKNIVHACDIGNPCQKYENYMYWAALINHEFDYQTKKEEKRGVEVTGFMKYKDPAAFFGGQIFFAKVLTLPLWEQISILFEGTSETVQNLRMNLKRLEDDKVKAVEN